MSNSELAQSIRYAKRIQNAMIQPQNSLREYIPGMIVMNRPKDTLSGDFYFFSEVQDGYVLMLADCTGHGVPGAMMSMLGYNHIMEAVKTAGITRPASILNRMHHGLRRIFCRHTDSDPIMDGMDAAVLFIDRNGKQLRFSGANRPLVIFRKGELIALDGTHSGIGCEVEHTIPAFKENVVELESGDVVFVFTDGFADQFGHVNKKKFQRKRLYDTFRRAAMLPMDEAKEFIEMTFDNWKGRQEQTDDVLLLAWRVE